MFSSSEDIKQYYKGYCPQYTEQVQGCPHVTLSNGENKNSSANILLPDEVSALDYWLCKYVVKTRKEDGSQYPP